MAGGSRGGHSSWVRGCQGVSLCCTGTGALLQGCSAPGCRSPQPSRCCHLQGTSANRVWLSRHPPATCSQARGQSPTQHPRSPCHDPQGTPGSRHRSIHRPHLGSPSTRTSWTGALPSSHAEGLWVCGIFQPRPQNGYPHPKIPVLLHTEAEPPHPTPSTREPAP